MRVVPIPANSDNYQYLIIDSKTNEAIVVDPSNLKSILAVVTTERCRLTTVLVTHHHWDHAAGTKPLAEPLPATSAALRLTEPLRIYASDAERIIGVTNLVEDGDTFTVGSFTVRVIATPCHTLTHVCYLIEDIAAVAERRALFSGDSLFVGGCGRFFEGTAEQMHESLNVRLASLPGDTTVYCGHEYTISNLKFAAIVEPKNAAIKKKLAWAKSELRAGRYTVPSTIAAEKKHNVFMRVTQPFIQKWLSVSDPIDAMQKLQELKNRHRGFRL